MAQEKKVSVPDTLWHTLKESEVHTRLETHAQGLSLEQAQKRLLQHGPNQLAQGRRRSAWTRLLMQFHNILLYVMMVAALITALLGHWIDTGVLLFAVVINAVIGFIQEGKAENALEAIRNMLSAHATVLRGGQTLEIDAAHLVPGDIVLLSSGDRVPADLRLFRARELRVEEAALTGESLPVEKSTNTQPADAPLGDRFGMAYSGTMVVHGQGRGVVVHTGRHTEIGRINQMLVDVQAQNTPLIRQIDTFGQMLAIGILIMCAVTFVLGTFWRGNPASDMFLMVVALAASAIPEGLPAILTVTLALGVQRMAKRHAIIRRLPAVEALGSVTVICSDKTGTLTRNEMTVQRIVSADHVYTVSGVGYTPRGEIMRDGQIVDLEVDHALALAIRAGVLCNDARLFRDEDQSWEVMGDPTEGALLVLGAKAGFSQDLGDQAWPRLDVVPFESQHRFMATYHRDAEDQPWIFTKGAPEVILDMCDHEMRRHGTGSLDVDQWRRMATDTAAVGLRVLALACKQACPKGDGLGFEDTRHGFVMLGLVGMIDPPRQEAAQAVRECHEAGIVVKMITGDHAETARAIGAQLGIGVGKPAVTGAEIGVMDDATLRRLVMDVDVFARASPEHKLRLVRAMQAAGQVVSMTGDGVNDAPALKRADVGVAMGMKGTEAAKQASDMVLADDNFATIVSAVRQGRAVYDNLKKFVLFMLPTNGGEALVVIAAILFELALPMTAAQVLWINLVTSSALGMALAFEPAESDIMKRPPRPPGERLLNGFFIWRVTMVSVLMMAGALGLFLWEYEHGTSLETARTMAVNAVVMCEMLYLINSRHIFASVLNREGLAGNHYVILAIATCAALQLAFTYVPWMNTVFGSAPLQPFDWVKIFAAGMLVFLVAELEKLVIRHTSLIKKLRNV